MLHASATRVAASAATNSGPSGFEARSNEQARDLALHTHRAPSQLSLCCAYKMPRRTSCSGLSPRQAYWGSFSVAGSRSQSPVQEGRMSHEDLSQPSVRLGQPAFAETQLVAALSINGSTLSLIGSIQPDAFVHLVTVPLDKIDAIVTVVIDAAQMDRCGKAREPQLRPACVGDVKCFRAAAHIFAPTCFLPVSCWAARILVPRRLGVSELADLGDDAFPLMAEIALASLALKEVTQYDKINVAALGNVVPQLHIHIVARCKTDPLWPKPVWGAEPPRASEAAEFARFVGAIREKLGVAEVS